MNENVTEGKYSNIEVTNKTVIGNLNFKKYTNIVYINNILNTDGFVVIHRHTASKEFNTLKNYKIHKEKNYGQSNILILRKL